MSSAKTWSASPIGAEGEPFACVPHLLDLGGEGGPEFSRLGSATGRPRSGGASGGDVVTYPLPHPGSAGLVGVCETAVPVGLGETQVMGDEVGGAGPYLAVLVVAEHVVVVDLHRPRSSQKGHWSSLVTVVVMLRQ